MNQHKVYYYCFDTGSNNLLPLQKRTIKQSTAGDRRLSFGIFNQGCRNLFIFFIDDNLDVFIQGGAAEEPELALWSAQAWKWTITEATLWGRCCQKKINRFGERVQWLGLACISKPWCRRRTLFKVKPEILISSTPNHHNNVMLRTSILIFCGMLSCRYVLVESADDDSWYGTSILPGTVEGSEANQHYLECCKVNFHCLQGNQGVAHVFLEDY